MAFDFDKGDALDDLLGGARTETAPRERPQPPASYQPRTFDEPCAKCFGSGRFRHLGACFACNGTGKIAFKTSPADRAKRRASSAAKRARKEAERREEVATKIEAFKAAHPAAYQWCLDNADSFSFAASLWSGLQQFGSLTPGQLAAVERCIAKREESRQAAAQREANAPAVTITKIEEAFAAARENGLRYPKLRLDTFTFSPASATSRWNGSIYVKEGGDYLGRITSGRFVCTSACGDDRQSRVIAAASDPESAAVAYGKRTGSCSCCGRELTNGESIDRGIGPVCAEKYGW